MATIRQLESGKWQVRVFKDGKQVSIGVFDTHKEAEIKGNEADNKLYYGEVLVDRHMTFSALVNEWFEFKKSNVKESTLEQLEAVKRLHILPHFDNKKLFEVKRADIIKWAAKYASMKKEDGSDKYAYGSRQKFLNTLKDIFNYAVYELEVLEKNPTDKLRVPIQDKLMIKDDIKYYSLEDVNVLLDYLHEYDPPRYKDYKVYYMLTYFLSRTGLRISEALALRWSDIRGNILNVDEQTSRNNNNKVKLTTLKNKSSYRSIKLDDKLLASLKNFRRIQNQMILKHRNFIRHKDMIIFQNEKGNYLTPSTVRDTIKGYCFNAGVEYKGTHGFRHHHAVVSLEAGATPEFISDRLGHKSITTTVDAYIDITPKIETDELDKVANYMDSGI